MFANVSKLLSPEKSEAAKAGIVLGAAVAVLGAGLEMSWGKEPGAAFRDSLRTGAKLAGEITDNASAIMAALGDVNKT